MTQQVSAFAPALSNCIPTMTFDSMLHGSLDDGVQLRAYCIAGRNWTLGKFYTQEDVNRDYALAEGIGRELSELGIEYAYAPTVGAMSGLVVDPSDLSNRLELPYGVEVWRNKALGSDGIPIKPNEAFIGSFGGCGVAIATGDDHCIVAHASRESLLDREYILGNPRSRDLMGVVDYMAAFAETMGTSAGRLTLRCLFEIPQMALGHPLHNNTHEEYNRRMEHQVRAMYGRNPVQVENDVAYLSTRELVFAQAEPHGFTIDRCSESFDLPVNGPYGWTRHPDESMKSQRNLIIVHRIS